MNIRLYLPSALMLGLLAACGGDQSETPPADEAAQPSEPATTPEAAAPAPTGPALPATAVLRNREGQEVGQVTFAQEGNEVVVAVEGRNFEGGPKSIYIHQVGRCEGPTFASAGEHFNPGNTQHGLNNPSGPHAGDLPGVVVDPDDGLVHGEFRTDRVTLIDGQPNSLVDADGNAIVIHSGADDGTTQPAGGSGDAVVCGVITRS